MEMEYMFCLDLHKKLKDRIKGKIFTKVVDDVVDDVLKVRIDMDDLWFETSYPDFSRSVIFGMTSDNIVCEVMRKYHKFLVNRMERYYFRDERN